jgi:hypothetical protein
MAETVSLTGHLREVRRQLRNGRWECWIQQLVRTPKGEEWRDLPVVHLPYEAPR